MKFNTRFFFLLAVIALATSSCVGPDNDAGQSSEKAVESLTPVPVFSADSAMKYVVQQIAFGPRVPNTRANVECANWLESTLKRYTPDVIVQPFKARAFDGTVLNGRNIIASFNPEAKTRILLCAHWDSRPWADHDPDPANQKKPIDGANDGAAGVGVLLELARVMAPQPPTVGVDIVLFDAEDYGPTQANQNRDSEDEWGLGSQYWSRNPHVQGYKARFGILLDMVGVENATFLQEGWSLYYAPHIVKKVWKIARQAGYDNLFIEDEGGYITDDHYYVNRDANIPTINIIHLQREGSSSGFYPYWHTVNDNLEKVSPASLMAVGDVLLHVVYQER
ncbi:MAG TPA: glutamine cyclotransferase [Bacteroidales bacterium]|nr:MAG: glutamine cyclotransferase [Bacteroidetes bacterium GWE2_42_24]OFY27806.1 MAG: glutamine cyclotransferase [Bacteroidetes bacterium GWF2_43_11]HAQ64888.1 glutamine cyclotransferase [Bacteroidales bacterium]HBZ66145.1 glutamine cyclotransferase [Bacteroidales bacterium]